MIKNNKTSLTFPTLLSPYPQGEGLEVRSGFGEANYNHMKTKKILLLFTALFLFVSLHAENPYPAKLKDYQFQHFIMYGQSLSTGHEAYPVSMENIEGNYMIGNQIFINYGGQDKGNLYPLRSTIALAYADVSESPLHGAVNHIRLKQKEVFPEIENKFIATSAGVSGQPIEALSKESKMDNFYNYILSTLRYGQEYSTRTDSSIVCPAIFWLQGEWNYQGHGNGLTSGTKPTAKKDKYKELMITLKNNIQADAKEYYGQEESPLFITYQAGAQYTKGVTMEIGMAQLEAANQHDDIICAGPVYQMTDVGGHLDGNGYRWYGEMLGKVYYKTKILGEDFKPLQPKRFERDSENLNRLLITYHVPEPPLVLDENTLKKVNNYGFLLYKGGVPLEITNVEVVDDTIIRLTSAADISEIKLGVVYAGPNTSGHGNVRDSDSYRAFFNYENPDKKDKDGNFVFNHGEKTSLIPPSGEPKDENGNVIYEQPYPLYNFSLAFYYELPLGENSFDVYYLTDNRPPSSIKEITPKELQVYYADGNVFVESEESGKLEVTLCDISGKVLKSYHAVQLTAGATEIFPLMHLLPGVYIVKAVLNDKVMAVRILI